MTTSTTRRTDQFYIDGGWVSPSSAARAEVVDPATEQTIAAVGRGTSRDVDRAVAAARRAFPSFSASDRAERLALLGRIIEGYKRRADELATMVRREMGAPSSLAKDVQVPGGLLPFEVARDVLEDFVFEGTQGSTAIVYEPIGVCAFITPWNWPLSQVAMKVAPALAVGCTMVLKPPEVAPLTSLILAEILDEAGVPPGVFNLVNGAGTEVGVALSSHPDVDMVSITGSTVAGVQVALNAAETVKRVTQELGGKSANILLDDVDVESTVARDVARVFMNSGQSCNATTRMLVPSTLMDAVIVAARHAAESCVVGPPDLEGVTLGPVASEAQFDKIQRMINEGIEEGATLVTGGPGRPAGLSTGFYVRPTVFADVTSDMVIARDEIFGPVLILMGYEDEDDAVRIANDSVYGLSGAVSGRDPDRARRVARRLRAGNVHINGASATVIAPFGGYKQSGNGREGGIYGMHEFLEVKAIFGDGAEQHA
jgi:aldehyde dehydrogenase (NAD+)